MRRIFLPLAAVSAVLAFATPALAGETRVEARGGVYWNPALNHTDATIGVAGGYDFDLGPGLFGGLEGSADKVLASGTDVYWGLNSRLGVKASPGDKLYVVGGYTLQKGPNAVDAGAGWEHSFGPAYGKVEYKHFFTEGGLPDSNSVSAGIGLKF